MNPDLPYHARAFAKINLTLTVIGARPDGYHDVRTVLQSVALHDRLEFEPTSGPFVLETNDSACPTDATNLVWRAAELVWRASKRRGPVAGARVRIDKRIPSQAGLGGGSSDGAAALRVFREWWCPGLSAHAVHELAASLGADVPFFLRGGTVLGVDRGDRLYSLAEAPRGWLVIARPTEGVSTADAYRWWDDARNSRSAGLAGSARGVGRGNGSAASGGLAAMVASGFGDRGNDLEGPVAAHRRDIAHVLAGLRRHGSPWAAMSGSGSGCFGVFEARHAAERAARRLASAHCRTWVTRTISAREYAGRTRPERAR